MDFDEGLDDDVSHTNKHEGTGVMREKVGNKICNFRWPTHLGG